MTREQFKRNLIISIEYKDQYVSDDIIEKFLDLNFEQDPSLSKWGVDDFYDFSVELCENDGDFWETVMDFELNSPESHYRIRTTYIDYDISDDEIEEIIQDRYTVNELESMSEDEYDNVKNELTDNLANDLPQTLEFEIVCNERDLDDIICDCISDETGYFINDFDYEVLEY